MRLPLLSALYICIATTATYGQLKDNVYRNKANEHYWQNRMPDKAYWQQDVAYKIHAVIHEEDNSIVGSEELTYWNNSPDTLTYVYFHLYQNAFVEGAYLHHLELVNKVQPSLGIKEAAGLGIVPDNIKVDGEPAPKEIDNTIMKVHLLRPLLPGGKVQISMGFNTYYDRGATRRRMKMYDAWGFMHYNGCQWYPKICVYDRMHGWDTYQHLNKEFYGDFGVFDVTLDFPSNYVVEASGVLQNRSEVLPDTLRRKLDVKNFANKPWDEAPSIITPYVKGERKKWHYIANNVHDFAFTADPSYRIATDYWNGIECVGIVQEPHAARWQTSAQYVAKILKTFSEEIGLYRYPKMVAADAQDGMEYPMITMDGGADPGYRGLLVHEIGHNWFYGQVGSNETYRAAMDEGFTQYLTALGLRKIEGDTVAGTPKKGYRSHFAEPALVLDKTVLNSYTMAALNQNEVPLNTHSDDFNNALNHGGGYGQVYYKTATMLYNLEYVLGDSLFKAALHHYFEQWKFAHPYFEDFRASIINYTHTDLSWFFDEWFETVKTVDYGIGSMRRVRGEKDWYNIRFKRTGQSQMPIDFTVTAKDGKKYNYYIPNTWFAKQTDAVKLPKWYGWGNFYTRYDAKINVPGGLKSVQIDTTYRLADRDLTDNYKRKHLLVNIPAMKIKLDGGTAAQTDRRRYRAYVRPDLWWNPIDGIKAGLHVEGDYMNSLHKLDASVWCNTHVLQGDAYLPYEDEGTYAYHRMFNYSLNFTTPVSKDLMKLQMQLNSRFIDGAWYHKGGFNWQMTDRNHVQAYVQSMWRDDSYSFDYLTDPNNWSSTWNRPNTSLNLAWTHTYNYVRGVGRYTISGRAPMLNGDNFSINYSYVQLEAVDYYSLAKFDVRTRLFGRFGMGSRLPYESLLYLAGANPEEQMENKYTRSKGFIPEDWEGISRYDVNNFQQGGGLNLRGYAGYYAPDERNGATYLSYKGRSGAAANVEVGFDNYIPLRPRFTRNWLKANLYAFADAGVMELSSFSGTNIYNIVPARKYSSVRIDAGLGMALTIKNWGVFDKAKPLTLRLDMPFFLNRAPFSNAQYVTFRYVVGINRAF